MTFLSASAIQANGDLASADPRRGQAEEAITRARHWVDSLEVDPVRLQSLGVPGKKAMAEILDAYAIHLDVARDASDSTSVLDRVTRLAQQTERPEYHDLSHADDASFDANIMSYLRVLFLLREFGLDTSRYATEARALLPRLETRIVGRGPWQQAMFARYYEVFDWDLPEILRESTMRGGLLDLAPAVATFDQGDRAGNQVDSYALVHELLVAFDYGRRVEAVGLNDEDRAYLLDTLSALILRYVPENNADLVAELVMCMGFLGWTGHPATDLGLDYLLDAQNPDGSWGDYERFRPNWREFLEHRAYLHTTLVGVWALQVVLDERRPTVPAEVSTEVVLGVAGLHQRRAEPSKARSILERHADIVDGRVQAALARIDLQLGALDRGQEHLRRALMSDPDDDSLHVLEALYLRQRRDWKAAMEAFRSVADASILAASDWYAFGDVLYRSGEFEAAVTAFERGLGVEESSAASHNYCAWILATELQSPERAMTHAERAIALASEEPEYHDTYLEALERAGRNDDARVHLSKIRSRFPDNASLAQRAKKYGL